MSTGHFRVAAIAAAIALLAGCASQQTRDGFPDPADAVHPEGLFVNMADLRSVRAGMSKAQLYPLLGAPHFDEGVFRVRRWNYLFDLPDRRAANGYTQCQYRIGFDDAGLASTFAWRTERCRKLVAADPSVEIEPSDAELPPPMPRRLAADALFPFDSAQLLPQGRQRVDAVVGGLRGAGRIQDVTVVGYTDRIGSTDYNRFLSMARAESIRDYLVQAGIPREVIHVEGRGELDPVVSCHQRSRASLVSCLQPNRRVELSTVAQP